MPRFKSCKKPGVSLPLLFTWRNGKFWKWFLFLPESFLKSRTPPQMHSFEEGLLSNVAWKFSSLWSITRRSIKPSAKVATNDIGQNRVVTKALKAVKAKDEFRQKKFETANLPLRAFCHFPAKFGHFARTFLGFVGCITKMPEPEVFSSSKNFIPCVITKVF